MNPKKGDLLKIIIPSILFLAIGILNRYTNVLQPLDALTISGDIPYVWDLFYILIYVTIIFGPLLYWWGRKKEGIVLAALLGAAGIGGLLLKEVFKLPRPLHTDEPGYGYPSFHAEVSVIGWGFLSKYIKYFVVIPVLTGISRIGCGDHYFTDVLGGWLLGLGSLYCAPYLFTVKVPQSVWKRWVIILVSALVIYRIGYNTENVPLILGLMVGFFLGCSAIKKSWEPVTTNKGLLALLMGILVSIVLLSSVLVLPEIISTVIAGLWMAVCPLIFVKVNLFHYCLDTQQE